MSDPVVSSADSSLDTPQESWSSFFLYLVIAVALALLVRTYIIAPYIVIGASMEPSFYQYHYLLIDKLSYRFNEPQRGDVVVLDLPQNEERALIKRVVGLPGETVEVENGAVRIISATYPEGMTLEEPYVETANNGGPDGVRISLKQDEYIVLGDNRRVSSDSRTWGVLPRHDIEGRVFIRLFPLSRVGLFPGSHLY